VSRLTRVAGVMIVRNEWPLLAASVTNLLLQHVDRLWVFDHASTDDTAAGLSALREVFGDRLTAVRFGDVPYLQGAFVTMALALISSEPFDWVYFVDADEFPLVPVTPLRDLLGAVAKDVDVVRYEVDNWIAPSSFRTLRVRDLAGVEARSLPNAFMHLSGELLAEQVRAGEANFFDIPFGSKVMVRLGSTMWLRAGAHEVGDRLGGSEYYLDRAQFRVAHLPFLSFERLQRRADHARQLEAIGVDADHGWQSHLVGSFTDDRAFEDFWSRHSIGTSHRAPGLRYKVDSSFASSLAPVLAFLAARPDVVNASGAADGPFAPVTSTAQWLDAVHRLHLQMVTQRRRVESTAITIVALQDQLDDCRRQLAAELDERQRTVADGAREMALMVGSRTWIWGRRLRWLARLGRR
jgi:hypothetical protein